MNCSLLPHFNTVFFFLANTEFIFRKVGLDNHISRVRAWESICLKHRKQSREEAALSELRLGSEGRRFSDSAPIVMTCSCPAPRQGLPPLHAPCDTRPRACEVQRHLQLRLASVLPSHRCRDISLVAVPGISAIRRTPTLSPKTTLHI